MALKPDQSKDHVSFASAAASVVAGGFKLLFSAVRHPNTEKQIVFRADHKIDVVPLIRTAEDHAAADDVAGT